MPIRYFFLMLLVALVVTNCFGKPTQEELQYADYGPYPSEYEQITKAFFETNLFDPYSAHYKFRQPKQAWNSLADHKFGWVVCGTLNAKNRYGGYVGIKPFYVMIYNDEIVYDILGPAAEVWCSNVYK